MSFCFVIGLMRMRQKQSTKDGTLIFAELHLQEEILLKTSSRNRERAVSLFKKETGDWKSLSQEISFTIPLKQLDKELNISMRFCLINY